MHMQKVSVSNPEFPVQRSRWQLMWKTSTWDPEELLPVWVDNAGFDGRIVQKAASSVQTDILWFKHI